MIKVIRPSEKIEAEKKWKRQRPKRLK